MPIQTTPCLPSTNTEHLACAFTQVAGSGDSLVRPLMRLPVQAHGFPLGELKLFPGASISLHIAVISGPWDVLRPLALDRSLLFSHSAVISRGLTKLGGVTFHPWSHTQYLNLLPERPSSPLHFSHQKGRAIALPSTGTNTPPPRP